MTQIERLKKELNACHAVVIGAGAGLSAAAGYTYDGERFDQYFADFRNKYGFKNMFEGSAYAFSTLEEYWAYWSRYILLNRYTAPPVPVHEKLLSLVRKKNHFVLTVNLDRCFQRAGFAEGNVFSMQGDFGLFQCSKPCCDKTYGNESAVKMMYERQADMKIPSNLVPRCPTCGAPIILNLRADEKFVQDKNWYAEYAAYIKFCKKHEKDKVVFLELGVGNEALTLIKYPFLQSAMRNPNATYVCINKNEATCPEELQERAVCIQDDIFDVLNRLSNL